MTIKNKLLILICFISFFSACSQNSSFKAKDPSLEDYLFSKRLKSSENFTNASMPELAIKELNSLASQYPYNSLIYNNLGLAYLKGKNLDMAIINFKLAIELDKNNQIARYNLGISFYKKNEPEKALTVFKELLLEMAQNKDCYKNQSCNYSLSNEDLLRIYKYISTINYDLGNKGCAISYSLLPNLYKNSYFEARRHARLLLSYKEVEKSKDFLLTSLKSKKSASAGIYTDLGISYYSLQDYKKAREVAILGLLSSDIEAYKGQRALLKSLIYLTDNAQGLNFKEGYYFSKEDKELLCRFKNSETVFFPIKFSSDLLSLIDEQC